MFYVFVMLCYSIKFDSQLLQMMLHAVVFSFCVIVKEIEEKIQNVYIIVM